MNIYKVSATPTIRTMLGTSALHPPSITAEDIMKVIADAVVRSVESSHGGVGIELQLDRPNHPKALDEIVGALAWLGFEVASLEVQEWASRAAEGFVLGLVGGGGAGASTKNDLITLLGLLAGAAAGSYVGSQMQYLKASYTARRLASGEWQLTAIQATTAA